MEVLVTPSKYEEIVGDAMFRGVDSRKALAAYIFTMPESEVTPKQRDYAKNITFYLAYGNTGLGRFSGTVTGRLSCAKPVDYDYLITGGQQVGKATMMRRALRIAQTTQMMGCLDADFGAIEQRVMALQAYGIPLDAKDYVGSATCPTLIPAPPKPKTKPSKLLLALTKKL